MLVSSVHALRAYQLTLVSTCLQYTVERCALLHPDLQPRALALGLGKLLCLCLGFERALFEIVLTLECQRALVAKGLVRLPAQLHAVLCFACGDHAVSFAVMN